MLENNSNTQFIVMTMSDYMNMVHEAARNLVAVQSATSPSTTEMEYKYMTRQEVAKLLKASLTSLWRWNKEGILCNYKDGNAKVVYLKEEVYDFIKNRKNTSATAYEVSASQEGGAS